ncbi:MAG: phage integrase SAM-like domain-containing protein [Dysgonamonadaceae bacterium]|jgi:hypothetical protein|nr:phage integrase SAM-like domain-containing protein [Dysgonamonadaceae bacterium]
MSSKKFIKVKEPIKIRFKKIANGNKSVYLAHWNGDKWEYEFLKDLYIVPDCNNPILKAKNEQTLQLAKAIQAQRIVELQNNAHGFSNSGGKSKINLIDYIKNLAEKKRMQSGRKRGTFQSYNSLIFHLTNYTGDKTTFKQVDKAFCLGFIDYLKTATNNNKGNESKPLNVNTQLTYMKMFETVIYAAMIDEVINVNPFKQIKPENKPKNQKLIILPLTRLKR